MIVSLFAVVRQRLASLLKLVPEHSVITAAMAVELWVASALRGI